MLRRFMSTTPTADLIRKRVTEAFKPTVLDIRNDSAGHAHHASMRGSSNTTESHFHLTIVSSEFEGKAQPARHRMVYGVLADELKRENGVHALQLRTKTPEEYAKAES